MPSSLNQRINLEYEPHDKEEFIGTARNHYNSPLDVYLIRGTKDEVVFVSAHGRIGRYHLHPRDVSEMLMETTLALIEKVRDPSVSPNA